MSADDDDYDHHYHHTFVVHFLHCETVHGKAFYRTFPPYLQIAYGQTEGVRNMLYTHNFSAHSVGV